MIASAVTNPHPRRIIFIPKDGSEPFTVDLEMERGFDICVQSGVNIDFTGGLLGGTGQKLLQAAIESMDTSKKFSSKIALNQKQNQRNQKHRDATKFIADFESTVPSSVRRLYLEVMEGIECTTDAYKIEMIEGISGKGVQFKEDNWQPILSWFKLQVIGKEAELPLEQRRSFYQLRAAFVTAACRMIRGDVRNANSMRLVQEGKGEDFDWAKYAEENKS